MMTTIPVKSFEGNRGLLNVLDFGDCCFSARSIFWAVSLQCDDKLIICSKEKGSAVICIISGEAGVSIEKNKAVEFMPPQSNQKALIVSDFRDMQLIPASDKLDMMILFDSVIHVTNLSIRKGDESFKII